MPKRITRAIGIVAVAASCADKPTAPPGSGPVHISIAAAVAAQTNGAEAIDVYVGYARTGGERIELLKHRTNISGTSTQSVSVPVDLTSCLADDSRPQPLSVCVLRIDVVLRDANDVALDSVAASPVSAAPGQTLSPPNIDLSAGTTIPFTFCTGPFGTIFAAYQDGSGPWQPITLAGGAGSIRLRATHGGLIWVQPMAAGGYFGQTMFASTSEFLTASSNVCRTNVGTATISGTVQGVNSNDVAYVMLGAVQRSIGFPTTSFALPNVPAGLQDLVAVRTTITGNFAATTGVVVRRDIDVQGSTTLTPIDFSTAPAPAVFPLTISNLGTETATYATLLITANSRQGQFAGSGNAGTGTWSAVPPSLTAPSDLHLISVTAFNSQDQSATRAVQSTMATPAARSLTFGPPLSIPTLTVLSAQPYARIRATLQAQSEYASIHAFNATQAVTIPANNRAWTVQVTQGYRAGNNVVTIETPNLSGIQGWSNTWGLQQGASVNWSVTGATVTGTQLFQPPTNGSALTGASRMGSITP